MEIKRNNRTSDKKVMIYGYLPCVPERYAFFIIRAYPKDFLKNEGADIFLLGGIVYSNAQDVEWVTELEYKLGEQIGEVTMKTDKASSFKNGTANKLPVGAKIYETDTPVYIVIFNDKEVPYLKMIEG